MNENRNIVWIAIIGVVILILAALLLRSPGGDGTAADPASSAPADTRQNAFPNDPPLAPAVPVLPPEEPRTPENVPGLGTTPGDAALPGANKAPPEVPAPSGPTPAQPNIPPR